VNEKVGIGRQASLVTGRTSAAVERGVAILLGADPATARGAVAALQEAGALPDGVALHALLVASRTGTDLQGAIAAIAAEGRTGSGWSDYELRAAREEAAEEVAAALGAPIGVVEVRLDGADAPEGAAAAVRAGRAGVLRLAPSSAQTRGLGALQALVEHGWAARLGTRWGCRVVPVGSGDGAVLAELATAAATVTGAAAGPLDTAGTSGCSPAYIDLLEAGLRR
jgi:hypothetical protein